MEWGDQRFVMLEVGQSKVLNCARKYMQMNIYTNSELTMASVRKQQLICELLAENVIQPFVELEEKSKFPETPEVTEGRQYHQRGLLHISDPTYLFFLELEKKRVKLLNRQILKKEWRQLGLDGNSWNSSYLILDLQYLVTHSESQISSIIL